MVFPFGVSIGDFLAVSQLIWNISTALSKNKGSKKDCEALLQTLSSLYNALSAAQAIILDASPAAVPRKEQSAVNGIVHEARMCKKLLEDFLKCTEKYRMSLLHGGGSWKVRDEWRKISWSLFEKRSVDQLDRDLHGHINALNLLGLTLTW